MTEARFLVIRWDSQRYIGRLRGGKFFHGFWPDGLCPSYMPYPADAEVLADYGSHDENDDDIVAAIEDRYDQDFPPEIGLRDGPGWLSPEGTFYLCEPWEHINIAGRLARLSGVEPESEQGLEQAGWVKVASDIVFGYTRRFRFTEAQMRTLNQLCALTENKHLRESILNQLGYSRGD